MMLGARTAAWAKSGYTTKDYVQDGLIAMWDAKENPDGANLVQGGDVFGFKSLSDDSFFLDGSNEALTVNGLSQLIKTGCSIEFVCTLSQLNDATIFDACTEGLSLRGLWARGSISNLIGSFDYLRSSWYTVTSPSYDNGFHSYSLHANGTYGLAYVDSIYYGRVAKGNVNVSSDKIRFSNGLFFKSPNMMMIKSVRIYNHVLEEPEVAANYAVDKARFNLT